LYSFKMRVLFQFVFFVLVGTYGQSFELFSTIDFVRKVLSANLIWRKSRGAHTLLT